MITPTIIKKGQMGVSEGLPSLVEPYLSRPDKTYPSPDPFTGSPRYPADQPQPREGNGAAAPRTGTAQQTARFVRARDDASGGPAQRGHADGHDARAIAADFADGSSGGAARGTSGDRYHTDTACGPRAGQGVGTGARRRQLRRPRRLRA